MGTVVSAERRGRRSLHGIPANDAPTLFAICLSKYNKRIKLRMQIEKI